MKITLEVELIRYLLWRHLAQLLPLNDIFIFFYVCVWLARECHITLISNLALYPILQKLEKLLKFSEKCSALPLHHGSLNLYKERFLQIWCSCLLILVFQLYIKLLLTCLWTCIVWIFLLWLTIFYTEIIRLLLNSEIINLKVFL